MKYDQVGIPTTSTFAGEIPLPHLKVTVSDGQNNPFGIRWQRYWDGATHPDLVSTCIVEEPSTRSKGNNPRKGEKHGRF
jgi:hypothetical protein